MVAASWNGPDLLGVLIHMCFPATPGGATGWVGVGRRDATSSAVPSVAESVRHVFQLVDNRVEYCVVFHAGR